MQRAVTWRAAAMAAILSVVAWGCTGGEPTSTREGSASAATEPAGLEGGTLRVGLSDLVAARISYPTYLDPQAPFLVADVDREILRCCLTRTLLSYTGRSTADGGTVLHPDLATGLPEISDDGLTWTFHLKEGIRYAPPLADVEITSPHIVRALERTATPAIGTEDNVVVFEPIEGVREFADGEASTISGLETPDPYTLRVHLSEVTNDLGYRFALPATAPIPPSPADPSARFGAAEGHDDGYGSFLVSSGPYMIEGSEDLDPSLPPEEQRQVSGLVTGESLTLVRNPSWSRETDELRKAYVDRIELRVVPWRQGWRAVEEGTLDLLYWGAPPPEQLERFEQDPDLRDRVFRGTCDGVGYVAIRLAAPPFDDVHVRRAAAYAFDEEEAARVASAFRWGGAGFFQFVPHAHIAPDPTLAGLLAGWDPYPYDLARAREEMSRSRYDVDHDGVCDHPSCRNVLALESNFGPEPKLDEVWAQGLEAIGITLDIRYLGWGRLYREMSDPESEAVLSLGPFWSAEYPSPAPLFVSGYGSTGIGSQAVPNFALLGATPDQLAGWGYEATSVPSVDTKITACLGLIGPAQQQCWAELDQLLMRQIVPAIPFVANNEIRIVSERVDAFSFDQAFSGLPALDQISLEPEDT